MILNNFFFCIREEIKQEIFNIRFLSSKQLDKFKNSNDTFDQTKQEDLNTEQNSFCELDSELFVGTNNKKIKIFLKNDDWEEILKSNEFWDYFVTYINDCFKSKAKLSEGNVTVNFPNSFSSFIFTKEAFKKPEKNEKVYITLTIGLLAFFAFSVLAYRFYIQYTIPRELFKTENDTLYYNILFTYLTNYFFNKTHTQEIKEQLIHELNIYKGINKSTPKRFEIYQKEKSFYFILSDDTANKIIDILENEIKNKTTIERGRENVINLIFDKQNFDETFCSSLLALGNENKEIKEIINNKIKIIRGPGLKKISLSAFLLLILFIIQFLVINFLLSFKTEVEDCFLLNLKNELENFSVFNFFDLKVTFIIIGLIILFGILPSLTLYIQEKGSNEGFCIFFGICSTIFALIFLPLLLGFFPNEENLKNKIVSSAFENFLKERVQLSFDKRQSEFEEEQFEKRSFEKDFELTNVDGVSFSLNKDNKQKNEQEEQIGSEISI